MKNAPFSIVASLALALSVTSSAHAAYIDSTGGTFFGGIVLGSAQQAVVFTTGPSGPFNIGELTLGMRTPDAGSYNFTVGLRFVDGSNNPTGADVASIVLNTGPMTFSMDRNVPIDFTSLGSLGAYSLASSTTYALVVGLGSSPNLGWGAVNEAFPTPDAKYGFTVQQNNVAWNGSSWMQSFGPVTSYFLAIGPTEVPEPSTYALFGLGLAGLALWKRRRAKA